MDIINITLLVLIGVISLLKLLWNLYHPRYIFISLDGNIGSGKSTLLKKVKENIQNVIILQEPVSEWLSITNENGKNFLDVFYTDKKRWSYTFQNLAYLTRMGLLFKTIADIKKNTFTNIWNKMLNKPYIIISERSILTDKNTFAKMLKDSDDMNSMEHMLYEKCFPVLLNQVDMSNVIYLQTDPVRSFERLKQRDRKEESTIPFEYIKSVDDYHNRWLYDENNGLNVLILDGNNDFELDDLRSKLTLMDMIGKIRKFIEYL